MENRFDNSKTISECIFPPWKLTPVENPNLYFVKNKYILAKFQSSFVDAIVLTDKRGSLISSAPIFSFVYQALLSDNSS